MKLNHVISAPVTNSSAVVYTIATKNTIDKANQLITALGLKKKDFVFSLVPGTSLVLALISNEKHDFQPDYVDCLSPEFRLKFDAEILVWKGFPKGNERDNTGRGIYASLLEYLSDHEIVLPKYDGDGDAFPFRLEVLYKDNSFKLFQDLLSSYDLDMKDYAGEVMYE